MEIGFSPREGIFAFATLQLGAGIGQRQQVSVPVRGFLLLLLVTAGLLAREMRWSKVSVPVRGFLLLLLLLVRLQSLSGDQGFSPREGIFAFATPELRIAGDVFPGREVSVPVRGFLLLLLAAAVSGRGRA